MDMDNLNLAAFENFEDNYDPESNFDADNFGKMPNRKTSVVIGNPRTPIKQAPATFNVTIDGTGNAQAHMVELFNQQFSITKFENANTNFGLKTLGAVYGTQLTDGSGNVVDFRSHGAVSTNAVVPANNNDLVYFTANGNLVYNYAKGSTDNVIVTCKEVPYRALFDYTGSGAFSVKKMRLQYSQAGQINEDLNLVYRNILGTTKSSSLSPKQFFTPLQFQSLLVDCSTPFTITKERGIQFLLEPNTKVSITFFIDAYTQPNV